MGITEDKHRDINKIARYGRKIIRKTNKILRYVC